MQTSQPPPAQQMQPAPPTAQAPTQPQLMAAPAPQASMQHAQYSSQPQYQQPQQQQQQQPPQTGMVGQYQTQQQPQQIQPPQPGQYQPQQQQAAPQQPQAPAPQPPTQYPNQGLNGGWQSDKDYQERRKMIAKIVHLLQQRKPNAPPEWLKKLPQMAKRLEESLYRSAKSFNEYNDANTLKQRLQQLAVNIGMKTKKMQQAQMAQQKMQHQQQQLHAQARQAQHRAQQPPPAAQPPAPPRPATQPMQQPPPQPAMQQAPPPPQPTQRIVNMAEINPIMSQPQPQPIAQQPLPTTAPAPAPVQSAPGPISAPMQYPPQHQQQSQPPPQPQPPQSISRPTATPPLQPQPPANGARPRQVSDRQQVLRHQQQRLLLLRHAAKCQHEDGRCPVTPHCAGMKRLWKHIAECKDQKCLVPHCVSSRYVLSHYHRCKDVRCPVCGPVREAIHRSHEKQKQIQAMKQHQQQTAQPNQNSVSAPQLAVSQPPIMQPMQPGVSLSAPLIEPPNKRQKIVPPALTAPPFQMQQGIPPPVVQQQLLHQSPPGQPQVPNQGQVKSGYVYTNGAQPVPVPPGGRPQIATSPGIAFSNGQVIMPKHTGPKPQEDHTLINCFSIEQIELHIASLNNGLRLTPQELKTKCLEVMRVLQGHQHGWVFNSPVDPIELGLPDYFEVIKKPMDLGTIRKKLENGCYHSLEQFHGNVHLTFDNAMMYNPEGSVVYNMAKEMKTKFEEDYEVLLKQLAEEEDAKRKNGEACLLCGCLKLLFEPPVFYCNGFNCPSKRIRRNSYYYVGGNNQYHWCHQCYQDLKDTKSIDLVDVTIRKDQLVKKKNDELHEESWVQCDRCERWIHQICALFNTRQNKDQTSEYACPRCTIEERRKKGKPEATSSTPMAEDLQRTKLSEYLEEHVREKTKIKVEELAREKAEKDKISIEEATKLVGMSGAITIRQVTSMDRKLEVRERMKKRYAFKNYPHEFSFRCKCITVFQNLDGVDVILFGLYVYEHDENNPPPNKRCVYVSYLDSVHFMRPRQMRTFVYHEILIAYLDYVRRRGFATAHIWACPPLKGDDYILYAKPEDQKTPKDDRLRQWYIDMLIESQRRGVVGKLTNMYDMYFKDENNDATVVPYMDGDYFPAEAENIIKNIEEGKTGKKSNSQGHKKKKSSSKAKQKKKSGRSGTRSAGLDEESFRASGVNPPGKDQQSLEEGGRDYVMVKLGETIQPMKESFIVAHLAWEGAREEDMVVPKEIQEYREKHNIVIDWKPRAKDESDGAKSQSDTINGVRPVMDGKADTETMGQTGAHSAPATVNNSPPNQAGANDADNSKREENLPDKSSDDAVPMDHTVKTESPDKVGEEKKESETATEPTDKPTTRTQQEESLDTSTDVPVSASVKREESNSQKIASKTTMEERQGKFAAMARKRGRDETQPEEEADKAESSTTVKDSKGRMVKVIDDDDEEMDCEFLNNRQAFLNLCQGNHYQFDQLRRAKHSSMMVLWHLHNRDAPKFVQQCTTCSREILSGYRFHCPTCADFDQCQECVSNPNVPRHPHQLKPIPVANGQQSELTDAQRKERKRSIQLHMTLLLHAATCTSPKCPSANCTKMKGLLKHGAQCQIKATGGCNVCKRIWALLQIHARQCKATSCPVPNCMAIRERVRQLKAQQQAMDDRRRQEMNRVYRGVR